MSDILFYDLNLFAIFLLVTLLVVIYSKREIHSLRSTLFRWLIITTIFLLALEIFSWVFDGKSGDRAYNLNFLFNTLFFALSIGVPCLWAFYIDYMMFQDKDRMKKQMKLYIAPVLITTSLALINLFYPIVFTIDSANVYSRLSGIWIGVILTYLIYLYLLSLVIKNRHRLTTNFIIGVMIFLFFPLIASVIQIVNLGLLLIWPATSMAIVFSYLLFETTSGSLDFLTGIYTRSRAEDYIVRLLQKQKRFSVMILDIDDFKAINDEYGHHIGDKVLIEMGRILQQVFSTSDVVARLGGDEFIIVTENVDKNHVDNARKEMMRFLRTSTSTYIKEAQFSLGIAYCDNTPECTMESMIIKADNNMYIDKAKNKNRNRRKDDKQ